MRSPKLSLGFQSMRAFVKQQHVWSTVLSSKHIPENNFGCWQSPLTRPWMRLAHFLPEDHFTTSLYGNRLNKGEIRLLWLLPNKDPSARVEALMTRGELNGNLTYSALSILVVARSMLVCGNTMLHPEMTSIYMMFAGRTMRCSSTASNILWVSICFRL